MPILRETPDISPQDLRALKSICRVSARHSLEAISSMSGMNFDLVHAEADLHAIDAIATRLGGEEQKVAAVSMKLKGSLGGVILVTIEPSPARVLLSRLVTDGVIDLDRLTPLQESALCETANIIAGAFCKGVGDASDRPLLASVPEIAIDMAASVIETPVIEATQASDNALVLDSLLRTREQGHPVSMRILLVPDPETIELLLVAGRDSQVHGAAGSIGG